MEISIKELIGSSADKIDLTDATAETHLLGIVEKIESNESILRDKFTELVRSTETPLEFRIALHIAKSRRFIKTVDDEIHIGIIYAMWGEQNRLQPRSASNPNGEDSLRHKIAQLNWICANTPIRWTLYVVDDGCPHNSGRLAQQILESHPDKEKVKVLFLNESVPTNTGPLRNLQSADDSRKGGAIIYGANEAINDGCKAVIYTDADNSVHLGQIGLLLEHYLEHGFNVVLGNRKDPSAVLVKQENRWGIGIKLLRHMQRMVGEPIFSLGILDSQAAFKLYDAKLLKEIIKDPAVFDFSFDSDWIAASIKSGEHFAKVAFAFIDSFAESASIVQGPMTTWETLLLGLVKVMEHRKLPHNTAMARVLKDEIKSASDLELLINSLPPALNDVSDSELGNPEIISPAQIKDWIIKQKLNKATNIK